jgi:hypothetical protein
MDRSPTCWELDVFHQKPLPVGPAAAALARCVVATAVLLGRRRVHLPRGRVGMRLRFGDGSSARVYRETVVDRPPPEDPCVLVVAFRLRALRGRGHAAFRAESLLNTSLFVGFPGFVSKLWLAHDEHQVYRGLYQWDGAGAAESYARALWWVLAMVCPTESIHYTVLPGLRRDDLLSDPRLLDRGWPTDVEAWCRPVAVV